MKVLDEFLEELKKFGVRKAARIVGIHEQTLYKWTQKKARAKVHRRAKGSKRDWVGVPAL